MKTTARLTIAGAIMFAFLPVAEAQQGGGKPSFKSATCACRQEAAAARRAGVAGGEGWAACMKRRGHNVAPGAGNHISC
jgi:hypothetical protein